jgi:hypothetical protein
MSGLTLDWAVLDNDTVLFGGRYIKRKRTEQ